MKSIEKFPPIKSRIFDNDGSEKNPGFRNLTRFGIQAIMFFVGFLFNNLQNFISFSGSAFTTWLGFIFPAWIWHKRNKYTSTKQERIFIFSMAGIGAVLGVFGTIQTLQVMIEEL